VLPELALLSAMVGRFDVLEDGTSVLDGSWPSGGVRDV